MEIDELTHEISLNYFELVDYLKKKYDNVKDCCLICHCIDEYKDNEKMLSSVTVFYGASNESQSKDNLVYCNFLEHIILHIKIEIATWSSNDYLSFKISFSSFTSIICQKLNNLYINGATNDIEMQIMEPIKNNYQEYQWLLLSFEKFNSSLSSKNKEDSLSFQNAIINNWAELWNADFLYKDMDKIKLSKKNYWEENAKKYLKHALNDNKYAYRIDEKSLIFKRNHPKILFFIPYESAFNGVLDGPAKEIFIPKIIGLRCSFTIKESGIPFIVRNNFVDTVDRNLPFDKPILSSDFGLDETIINTRCRLILNVEDYIKFHENYEVNNECIINGCSFEQQ